MERFQRREEAARDEGHGQIEGLHGGRVVAQLEVEDAIGRVRNG